MGSQWNSLFYSSDPASSKTLTYICWLCWNKRAFIPDNLAEATQPLRQQLENNSIIFTIGSTETEGMYFSFFIYIYVYTYNTNCKIFCKYMLLKCECIFKTLQVSKRLLLQNSKQNRRNHWGFHVLGTVWVADNKKQTNKQTKHLQSIALLQNWEEYAFETEQK